MKKLILLLLALAIMLVTGGWNKQGFNQGLSMKFGTGVAAVISDHRLFIDGSSAHYLLIDGSNHYLKIDGA